jgi:glycerol-3-phosphate acyltransferase PlsY
MLTNIALIIVFYFLGAFPHLYLMCKLHKLSTSGDLHMNLWQGAGPFWGITGVLIDVLKGVATILICYAIGLDLWVTVACGLTAVAGQMWPVFSKFDGEKGNTVGLGMAVTLAYLPTFIAIIPAFIGLLSKLVKLLRLKGQTTRTRFTKGAGTSDALPIGVALAFFILPLASWFLDKPIEIVIGFIILFVIIMIRRLTQGLTEDIKAKRKLGQVLLNRFLLDRSVK